MPKAICSHPGCRELIKKCSGGYCANHKPKVVDDRESRHRRGYGTLHEKVRKAKLCRDPLCEECRQRGRAKVATVLHHIDGNQYNVEQSNLKSLCRDCHEQIHGRQYA